MFGNVFFRKVEGLKQLGSWEAKERKGPLFMAKKET